MDTHAQADAVARQVDVFTSTDAFHHAIVGMALLDLDGRYVRVNPVFCAFLGRPAEAVVGRHYRDFTDEADHRRIDNDRAALLSAAPAALRAEVKFWHSDGSPRWARRLARVIFGADGNPAFLFAQYVDVTDYFVAREAREREQRRTEALLALGDRLALASENHEELLRCCVQSISELIGEWAALWLADANGGYRVVAVHHPDPDVVAALLADRSGRGSRAATSGLIAATIASGRAIRLACDAGDPRFNPQQQAWIREFGLGALVGVPLAARGRVLGALLTVRPAGRPAYDADDEVVAQEVARRVALALDNAALRDEADDEATRRLSAEAELRRSEEYYRAIVQNATDVIVIVDRGGRVRYVSPSMQAVLGRACDDGDQGEEFLVDSVHPDDVEEVRTLFHRLVSGESATQGQLRMRHVDGSYRFVDARSRNMLDHPAVAGIIVSLRDITEQELAGRQLLARAAEQAAVARLGNVALATPDVLAVLDEVVRTVGRTLGVDHATVAEVQGAELVTRASFGLASSGERARQPLDGGSLAATAARLGRVLTSAELPAGHPDRGEPGSGIAVPVGGGSLPFGVVTALSYSGRVFTAEDRVFMQAVANVVAATFDRQRSDARVRHQALHDALTGLPNRRLLLRRMARGLEAAYDDGRLLGLLLLDLDNFKVVNDSLGHEYGDRLLVQVTERLAQAVRNTDTVARLGGDEFAICLPGLREAGDAVAVARKLIEVIEQPMQLAGLEITVGASIGIALAPVDATDPSALMQRADIAMYRAKRSGGGWTMFEPELDAAHTQRLTSLAELRNAIDSGAFTLHYQPLVDLRTGSVRRVEALIRWTHPERGVIPPAEFIPLAEQSRMIPRLTAWVLEEAAKQCARWRAAGHDVTVSVNVSGTDLDDAELPRRVAAVAARHGLPADALMLEITESEVVDRDGRHALSRLADLGIPLAIDDFGTGYSSLSYLKLLPVSEVKIDRAFVMRMRGDERDVAIVRSVVELATTLGLEVVAEGVEDAETAAILVGLGVAYAQGYHFGRPAGAADVAPLLGGAGTVVERAS